MNWIIKYISIIISGNLLRFFFSFFPIKKDAIVFISFDGNKISCNPLYIYKYIVNNNVDYSCKWVINKGVKYGNIPENQIVFKGSFHYYRVLLTARFIVTNDRLPSYLLFRRGQYLINTWHGGGAFKRTFGYPKGLVKWYLDKTTGLDSKRTSLFLTSSRMWTKVIARDSFHYYGKVLESGFPRNDVLFESNDDLKQSIRKRLEVDESSDIILYAPTHRGSNVKASTIINQQPINLVAVCEAWEKKNKNKSIVLFRGHHAMKKKILFENVIDVSDYPDMQELILVSSLLISDYSSCMWDYALTHKPCFIYAPDFDEYLADPGFESNYKQWPFPICRNNEDLIEELLSFEKERYSEDVDQYLDSYGSYEQGFASKMLVSWMEKQ